MLYSKETYSMKQHLVSDRTQKQLRMLVILGMLFGMLAPLAQPATTYAAAEPGWTSGASIESNMLRMTSILSCF